MQFIKEDDLYKVARITGPSHNLLGVRLSDVQCSIKMTPLPMSTGEIEVLDGQKVRSQVLKGLDAVNLELCKHYFISEIQFIPSDTASSSVYIDLIQSLIQWIDAEDHCKGLYQ